MKEYMNVLMKSALFKNVKEVEMEHMLICLNCYSKNYKNDEYVFFAGSEVNYISVILSGSVEVIKENQAGSVHIVAFLGPSNLFGEGIVCTAARLSPVTVRVKEDSKILFIPYERITKSCSNSCNHHVQLIQNMMTILGEKNYNLNKKIELLTLKGMREKIVSYLLSESHVNNSLTFQLIPNRNELAEYLNVSRTSMCRELSRMKDENLIDYYQNSFKLKDIEALKECLM